MSQYASCLYFGAVVHQRFAPRRHRLRYRMFQGLFDLDELTNLGRNLRFFSYNRINLISFHESDHGPSDGGSLRDYVEELLNRAGLAGGGGKIILLCMPRIFGFVFNPLSIYYCYNKIGNLIAMIYEVNNTFRQRHTYLIPVGAAPTSSVSQACDKDFYVSPFMGMDMKYRFRISLPGSTLTTTVNGEQVGGGRLIFASFTGVRRELSDRTLLMALLAYPLLTIGVVAAIHLEAVKLLAKGLPLRRRPAPPAQGVTMVELAAGVTDE